MAETNRSDTAYILTEYNTLRDEISQKNTMASSTWTIAILASLTILGYFIQVDELSPLFYPIPFFIILPSLFICLDSFRSIFRISGYIRVFLEKEEGLQYENRHVRWLSVVSKARKTKRDLRSMSLRVMIVSLHIGLGFLTFLVFVWKTLFKDTCWESLLMLPVVPNCWISVAGQILLYLSPLPFYLYAYRLSKKDWRAIYDEYWKEIKKSEKEIDSRFHAKKN